MSRQRFKRILHALLYPHGAIFIILVPLSAVMTVCSLVFLQEEYSAFSYVSYAISAYTLTALCLKMPTLIRFFQGVKSNNRYVRRWLTDASLRVKVSLYMSLAVNTGYALFQLFLGFTNHTFWYYSLAVYYLLLAFMRFFLLRDVRSYVAAGDDPISEWKRYRFCGVVLLCLNLALAVIVFFMTYWGREFTHHAVVTIALAAYTFGALTSAIIGAVRARRYNSPLYSAARAVSLAAAAVSMLTLESAMLKAFGTETDVAFRRQMTILTGLAICAFVLMMALYMICRAGKQLKCEREKKV